MRDGRFGEHVAATHAAAALFQQQPLAEPFACTAIGGDARACALSIIDDFGLRAFRRPLRNEEQQAFMTLYERAPALPEGLGEVWLGLFRVAQR